MAEGGLRYKDKVTIVTGGSKGIGKGCVEVFLEAGAKVVFCARGEKESREFEASLDSKYPGNVLYVRCDTSNEEDIKNLIDKTLEKYGQIDCVVNNAGTHPPVMMIDDTSADDFRDLLNLNLVGYFLVAKYALPHLRKTKGNLIQVSSLVQRLGQQGSCAYIASKGGVSALTRSLAIDEAIHGVRVNTFEPGSVWTPLWDYTAHLTPDPESCIQKGKDSQLLGRMGTLEECGKACLYLAADATFCTGISLLMSGGAELNYGIKNPTVKPQGDFV